MKTIGDLLNRDLSRKIEEIIQVDQADEQSVHDEITEYVATDSIREQYQLFRAIADAPSEPHRVSASGYPSSSDRGKAPSPSTSVTLFRTRHFWASTSPTFSSSKSGTTASVTCSTS
ncbi:MAG: hypothetical protein WBW81_09555 [Methylocella sp.]